MRAVKRIVAAVLAAVAASLVVAVLATPTTSAQHLNEQRKVHGVSGTVRRVVVDNESGRVRIQPGATSSVTKTERWNLSRPRYRQDFKDGTLTVRASCPDLPLNNCSVDLDVVVPRAAQVVAENVNGSVNIEGFSGRSVSASVTNGDVSLVDLRSPAVSGETDNGDVIASLVGRPARLRITSTNGDVVASVPKGTYDIETETTNGEVSVSGLKDDPGAKRSLTASTTNGDVELSGK